MATCAVTGQTVVSHHYVLFQTAEGEKHFYSLASPTDDVMPGVIQTLAASLDEVAEDISRMGKDGLLRWNPKQIVSPTGGIMKPLGIVEIPIKTGTPEEIITQIRKGGPTRVRTPIRVEGGGVLAADITLDIWPPFGGI